MTMVLVTGGAGFIGRHVVRTLLEAGHRVVILDNFSNSRRDLPVDERVQVVEGDVTDVALVDQLVARVDHVVHLAALVSVPLSLEDPDLTFRTNVEGTHVVFEAARKAGLKGRCLYASSAAVYGQPGDAPTREADAAGVSLPSPYAASKAMDETLGNVYRDVYGLRMTGMRFFNVYGAGQDPNSPYSGVLSRIVQCVEQGDVFTVFGDGRQTRDFVAVHDVASVIGQLIGLATTTAVPAVVNLGTGSAVNLLEVVGHVSVLKGVTLPVQHMPARAGDVRNSCADIGLLKTVLPLWQPMLLPEGLRRWL